MLGSLALVRMNKASRWHITGEVTDILFNRNVNKLESKSTISLDLLGDFDEVEGGGSQNVGLKEYNSSIYKEHVNLLNSYSSFVKDLKVTV